MNASNDNSEMFDFIFDPEELFTCKYGIIILNYTYNNQLLNKLLIDYTKF